MTLPPVLTLHQRFKPPASYRNLDSWKEMEQHYQELLDRIIINVNQLEQWILDWNKLNAGVKETFGWRYIRLNANLKSAAAVTAYENFIQEISPNSLKMDQLLTDKLMNHPLIHKVNSRKFGIHLRILENKQRLFVTENMPRIAEEKQLSKDYSTIVTPLKMEVNGQVLSPQQASIYLEHTDRKIREQAFRSTNQTFQSQRENIDQVFTQLVEARTNIAVHAGFENYRDYKFADLARFDYTPAECAAFHDALKTEVLPAIDEIYERRKTRLGVKQLRPWDILVDVNQHSTNNLPLLPADQLVENTKNVLRSIHPYFSWCLQTMQDNNHLDLMPREGKRPGAFNMPLGITGIPYLFMNASGSKTDVRTFLHEMGHAVHSFLMADLPLASAQLPPPEIAELSAMSMELLSLDYWHHCFEDDRQLLNAKIWMLENIVQLLPWIALIDEFQHWIYLNPNHTALERQENWLALHKRYTSPVLEIADLQDIYATCWHKQLHLFEVPFYYIEYGFAQLGALAIWKNYKNDKDATIQQFMEAMKLGYAQSIPKVYKTAGVEFNWSRAYVKELIHFVMEELRTLWQLVD